MGGILFLWTAAYQTCLRRACVPRLLSGLYQLFYLCLIHSRPQSPRSFWPAAGIKSSGPDFLSMLRVFVSHSQPIRFARFDGKFVNRGLPVLDQARAAAGQKNRGLWGREWIPELSFSDRLSRGTKLWGQGKAKRSSAHDWRETGRRSTVLTILVPRAPFPLTSVRKTRALGASILGMRFVFSFYAR